MSMDEAATRFERACDALNRSGFPKLSPRSAAAALDVYRAMVERLGKMMADELDNATRQRAKALDVPVQPWSDGKYAIDCVTKALKSPNVVIWRDKIWDMVYDSSNMAQGETPTAEETEIEPQIWLVEGLTDHLISKEFSEQVLVPLPCVLEAIFVTPADVTRFPHRKIAIIGMFTAPDKIPAFRTLGGLDPGQEMLGGWSCLAFSGLDFLKQKFVVQQTPPRAEARQIAREKRAGPPPTIRTVALRKPETKKDAPGENDPDSHYHVQFYVARHVRKQWYPSINGHRPRWIEPYVKGPKTAPFQEPKRNIFVAKR